MYRALCHAVAAIGLLASLPLAAQNLLQNPGFSTALDPWEPFDGFGQTAIWVSFDAGGNPNSGSVFGTIPADSVFRDPPYAFQCLVVAPNTTYLYGGKAFMPSASTASGAASLAAIGLYPNTNCIGVSNFFKSAPRVLTQNAWVPTRDIVTTPQDVHSARIYMYVHAPDGATMQSYFDDMFLMPDAIFRGGFE
jgi:hypothetical protein